MKFLYFINKLQESKIYQNKLIYVMENLNNIELQNIKLKIMKDQILF